MCLFDSVMKKLEAELEVNSLGSHRTYKFILQELKDPERAKEFMILKLGFSKWEVNKIIYNINYNKKIYQQQLNIGGH